MSVSAMRALREATHEEHEAIERVVPLTQDHLRLPDYVAYLERALGFYAPLEARLSPALAGVPALDLAARQKTPLLERDLESLGVDAGRRAELPRCAPELPASPSAALGVLYVLEGATLGGRIIARHLEKNLPELPASARRFLEPYGEDTGPRWKAFGAAVEAFAAGPDADLDAMCAAARTTFTRYGEWLHV
jgi:heme oxygenase